MEFDIFKKLNETISLLKKILAGVDRLEKDQALSNDWLDSTDTMRVLRISDRSLYRLRKKYPHHSKKIAGKWYYCIRQMMGGLNV